MERRSFPVSLHLPLCCLTPSCTEALELDRLQRQCRGGAGTLRAVFVPQHFVTRSTSTESPLCSTHCCSPLDMGSLWEQQVSVHGCGKCPLTENFHTDATLRFGENDQLGRDLTGSLGIVGQSHFLLPLLAGGSSG